MNEGGVGTSARLQKILYYVGVALVLSSAITTVWYCSSHEIYFPGKGLIREMVFLLTTDTPVTPLLRVTLPVGIVLLILSRILSR
ncbi:hypothetical protein DRP04_01085 [Archaeoglobales archaeon]|nr:MAG: hypothetical protein DRP04_01085 [Archaeoglobales archaeon]